MNLVYLPAMEPEDATYGRPPARLGAFPQLCAHEVRFPGMVWYNDGVRREAARQIEAMGLASLVLVGFSKSGLGAWNLALALRERVAATIVFDAPMARTAVPVVWGAAPFYADEAAWQRDLPARGVAAFAAAMPASHRLVLISGEHFHDEMASLAQALHAAGVEHTFLDRRDLRHHWESGWLEAGLAVLYPGSPSSIP